MSLKRHELKYYLNDIQMQGLLRQLSCCMELDRNCDGLSGYRVRSLYFDSIDDECLYEKQSGFLLRKKIRLRTYGMDETQAIKFEIKSKHGQIINKTAATLSRDDARRICGGDYALLLGRNNPVLDSIYTTFAAGAYKPKVIVEYRRVAFALPASDVRITFDLDLRSNINHLDLFSAVSDTMPVTLNGKQILEIKYSQFFPGYLKKIISGVSAERMAISKYTLARRFHKIQKWEDN
ncbi:MAG TPA: polyphosphate polymerase domain-containing protein [Gammaproteobacteria bacterium]